MSDHSSVNFPLREAYALVSDLMTPNPWIYWTDFLFHILLGWIGFIVTLQTALFSIEQVLGFLITVLAFYRSAVFVHELAHLKKGTFQIFRWVWNLICGIPMMIPSFMYDGVHNDHHKRDIYGTHQDGEYLPFATQQPAEMVRYVLLSFILPLLLVARFLLLTPLSYLIPPLRKLVWQRASSLTINTHYIRAPNAIRNDHYWWLQEFATFAFAAIVVGLVIVGLLPYQALVLWYVTAVCVFILNSLRTLAAHAYRNPGDHSLELAEQYLDSINIPGNFLTTLWAPVGLRFHATHHLFMSLPYHNLGKAQQRLVNGLSDNSLYLKTIRKGLWDALKRIWKEASTASTSR